MKKSVAIFFALGILAASATALRVFLLNPERPEGAEILASSYSSLPTEPAASLPTTSTEEFKGYVLSVMEQCRSPLSAVRRDVLAGQLANIVPARLDTRADQELFILLLCIENKFQSTGKSSAGAVGIAQLMPQYAQGFADLCNLGKLEPGDLDDPATNATIGACFFKSLLVQLKSPVLAVAAYNAGAASNSVKNLKALSAPVPETSAYVSKMAYLRETMNANKALGSNE